MTRLLASVRCPEEALLALESGADLIDLKEPLRGSLGAVHAAIAHAIVRAIGGRRPVSAVIGDLPMDPAIIGPAVATTIRAGVDYVKVGFFPDGDWDATLHAISQYAAHTQLIAVLFADDQPNLDWLNQLAQHGWHGAMLDTRNKTAGPLTACCTLEMLSAFAARCQQLRLVCGLAGSLRAADVPQLLTLGVDYLGFRSALCQGAARGAILDTMAVLRLVRLVHGDSLLTPTPGNADASEFPYLTPR